MSSFDSESFAAAGQSHLLQRLDQLSGEQAAYFQSELERLDLPCLQRLWQEDGHRKAETVPEPPVLVELIDQAARTQAFSKGQALLAEGKVACLTVARKARSLLVLSLAIRCLRSLRVKSIVKPSATAKPCPGAS